MKALVEKTPTHHFGVTPPRGLKLVRGEGAHLWDDRGRRYIDCVAGHGCASLGHGHPAWVEAVTRQAAELVSCPAAFDHELRDRYLAHLALAAPAGLGRAFLCNSGAEAVEAALKFARFATGRTGFVAAMRGFHGRTFGAMSATFTPAYREPFEPGVPGFSFVPFGDADAVGAALGPDTAAVILEVIQGEGGVHVAPEGYLAEVRRRCDAAGILLMLDEVQTGFGRTGRMFACEHDGVVPDLMCLAKGMAGGFPMGAVLCADHLDVPVGRHGSTFGGNPLACAAGLATQDVIVREGLVERARVFGDLFRARLETIDSPLIREVRGRGLMVGIQLTEKVAPILKALSEEGVLAMKAGPKVLRFLPPLVIEWADLTRVAQALQGVIHRAESATKP
jgi:acetylornithine/LysW-gamma-L-lysine aminotransferase